MSDTEQHAPAPDAAEAPTDVPAAPPEGKQESFDAEYVAKLRAESAKYRTAAKANEDAAKRLAEIEESQKTEQQKLAERLAEAERKASEAELRAARSEVAREKGVPAELLVGSTVEELAEHADKLLTFRGEAPRKPAAPPANDQGNVGSVIGTKQLGRSDLKNMSPQQIEAARESGALNDLMSGRVN